MAVPLGVDDPPLLVRQRDAMPSHPWPSVTTAPGGWFTAGIPAAERPVQNASSAAGQGITDRPTFSIRKRASLVYTLDDYVASGVLAPADADVLRRAVADRQNILVAGGTGSGKTTLANALLAEPAFRRDRVVVIEDTKELQCPAEDRVELLTKATDPPVNMTDLLRVTLRLRPDRIVVGEVRGPEALALLKAWNTGHPGGVATVHANSAADALHRLEDLAGEASATVPRRAIASAVNVVAFIERTAGTPGGRVSTVARVRGLHAGEYAL